jgi:signal transduction histidine kinase
MPLAFLADPARTIAQRVDHAAHLAPRDALLLVRWIALALLLGFAFLEPEPTRVGLPVWVFMLLFAAYSLPVDLLGRRNDWIRCRLQPVLDLVLAGTLYLLNSRFDGVVYTLVFLAVVSAAATLPLRAALFYVVVAMLVTVGFELLLRHPWSLDVIVGDIGVRLLRLALVAFVAAILARRLTLEQLATRRAQLEAEQLAELDRLRGNFVAAVSHDLQTPLTAIRAALGLLETSAGDHLLADEAQLLSNARRNVDRLGLQIDDLLLLNQLEAGQALRPAHRDHRCRRRGPSVDRAKGTSARDGCQRSASGRGRSAAPGASAGEPCGERPLSHAVWDSHHHQWARNA